MCELCDKQVAAVINNRNADTILKMSQAATNLYDHNFTEEAKQVAAALVKLLPKEVKTSGEAGGEDVKGDPFASKATFDKLVAEALGLPVDLVRTVFVRG